MFLILQGLATIILFVFLACAAKFDCPFVFCSGQAAHVLAEMA